MTFKFFDASTGHHLSCGQHDEALKSKAKTAVRHGPETPKVSVPVRELRQDMSARSASPQGAPPIVLRLEAHLRNPLVKHIQPSQESCALIQLLLPLAATVEILLSSNLDPTIRNAKPLPRHSISETHLALSLCALCKSRLCASTGTHEAEMSGIANLLILLPKNPRIDRQSIINRPSSTNSGHIPMVVTYHQISSIINHYCQSDICLTSLSLIQNTIGWFSVAWWGSSFFCTDDNHHPLDSC